MITHVFSTGNAGEVKIEDNTDTPNSMLVNVFIKSSTPVSVSQMPWAWELGKDSPSPIASGWKSFSGEITSSWRQLVSVHVTTPNMFTFYLGNTNTPELGGPEEFNVDLYNFDPEVGIPPLPRLARVYVDGVARLAEVYVYKDGWPSMAVPYIRTPLGWRIAE